MQSEGNYEQRVSLEYFFRKNIFHIGRLNSWLQRIPGRSIFLSTKCTDETKHAIQTLAHFRWKVLIDQHDRCTSADQGPQQAVPASGLLPLRLASRVPAKLPRARHPRRSSHHPYLVSLLVIVRLINAECIVPDERSQQVIAPADPRAC
jgi:hypothetical protein